LFDKACTETCPKPTATASGWFNDVYNVPFAHNCNCGTRVEEWENGKESVKLCHEACLENHDCKSFGLWTTESKKSGYCALFDKACTETCPKPTATAKGWFNDVYNVC